MKFETGTFELHDNDMWVLSSAETDEVAGGTGFADLALSSTSGPGSSQSVTLSSFFLGTSNTSAIGFLSANVSSFGPNNSIGVFAEAIVGPPF
jgi:hypothetical protein